MQASRNFLMEQSSPRIKPEGRFRWESDMGSKQKGMQEEFFTLKQAKCKERMRYSQHSYSYGDWPPKDIL